MLGYHVCAARSPDTLKATRFVQQLLLSFTLHPQLMAQYDGHIQSDLMMKYAAQLKGLDVEYRDDVLKKSQFDAELAFKHVILEPLKKVEYTGPNLLLIVDSLDESLDVGCNNSIARLVLKNHRNLPKWLRILVTARTNHEITTTNYFLDCKKAMLPVVGTPEDNNNDVSEFVEKRLIAIADVNYDYLRDESRDRCPLEYALSHPSFRAEFMEQYKKPFTSAAETFRQYIVETRSDNQGAIGQDSAEDRIVRLESSDNVGFDVAVSVATVSKFIRTMLEERSEEDQDADKEDPDIVPISNVSSDILEKVIDFSKSYNLLLNSTDMFTQIKGLDVLKMNQKAALFDLFFAADYMDIKPLTVLVCAQLVGMIKGKSVEELRQEFDSVNDFTSEEESHIVETLKDLSAQDGGVLRGLNALPVVSKACWCLSPLVVERITKRSHGNMLVAHYLLQRVAEQHESWLKLDTTPMDLADFYKDDLRCLNNAMFDEYKTTKYDVVKPLFRVLLAAEHTLLTKPMLLTTLRILDSVKYSGEEGEGYFERSFKCISQYLVLSGDEETISWYHQTFPAFLSGLKIGDALYISNRSGHLALAVWYCWSLKSWCYHQQNTPDETNASSRLLAALQGDESPHYSMCFRQNGVCNDSLATVVHTTSVSSEFELECLSLACFHFCNWNVSLLEGSENDRFAVVERIIASQLVGVSDTDGHFMFQSLAAGIQAALYMWGSSNSSLNDSKSIAWGQAVVLMTKLGQTMAMTAVDDDGDEDGGDVWRDVGNGADGADADDAAEDNANGDGGYGNGPAPVPAPDPATSIVNAIWWGLRPLSIACHLGCLPAVKLLVETLGADVNPPPENLQLEWLDISEKEVDTPLCLACDEGHIEVVALLLEKGAKVNAKDEDNNTPLHLACHKGHAGVVELLLINGANVNAKDSDKCTPLHRACLNDHKDLVTKLLDKGANVNAKDEDKFTPLHLACQEGHAGVVAVLLDHEADVHAKDSTDGETPLHKACLSEVAILLLDKGANVNAKNEDGDTSLHLACWSGRFDMVSVFLEKGADVNAKGKDDWNPLVVTQFCLFAWRKKNEEVEDGDGGDEGVGEAVKEKETGFEADYEAVEQLLLAAISASTADCDMSTSPCTNST